MPYDDEDDEYFRHDLDYPFFGYGTFFKIAGVLLLIGAALYACTPTQPEWMNECARDKAGCDQGGKV